MFAKLVTTYTFFQFLATDAAPVLNKRSVSVL